MTHIKKLSWNIGPQEFETLTSGNPVIGTVKIEGEILEMEIILQNLEPYLMRMIIDNISKIPPTQQPEENPQNTPIP
jgi:hypothetical protein